MSKRVNGLDIVSEYVEYGVEYSIGDEIFVHHAEDEDEARLVRAVLNGQLVVRHVFESAWADASGL